jgi:hypothetical protein
MRMRRRIGCDNCWLRRICSERRKVGCLRLTKGHGIVKRNERALPVLDQYLLNLIFEHVYDGVNEKDAEGFADKELGDFVKLLLTMQNYNYWYRFSEYQRLFPLFEETVGPMETNSEGTSMWLALGLAIKELYGLRSSTLESLLKKITVRK